MLNNKFVALMFATNDKTIMFATNNKAIMMMTKIKHTHVVLSFSLYLFLLNNLFFITL